MYLSRNPYHMLLESNPNTEDHNDLHEYRSLTSPLTTITNTYTNFNYYQVITALCFWFILYCQCPSTCAVYSYNQNSVTSPLEPPHPLSSFDNIFAICSVKMKAYWYWHGYKAFIWYCSLSNFLSQYQYFTFINQHFKLYIFWSR